MRNFGEFQRFVAADVRVNELRQGFLRPDRRPQKILVLGFADGVAEACAHRVNEDQIRFVQEAVWIFGEFVGGPEAWHRRSR